MFNILVAEDEKDIRNMLCEYLSTNGFNVHFAANGNEALDIIDKTHIDLLITDIMMPGMDGLSLAKELRESGYALPVLMLTAKETIEDKENGYRSGTDDYLVKPFILKEVLLRVNALLRRSKIAASKEITIGNAKFDYNSFTASIADSHIEIPKKEFMLLFRLLSQPGRIFTRSEILDEIWGLDNESDESTVNVHICRLREKLSACDGFEIITVKGLGYKAVVK